MRNWTVRHFVTVDILVTEETIEATTATDAARKATPPTKEALASFLRAASLPTGSKITPGRLALTHCKVTPDDDEKIRG